MIKFKQKIGLPLGKKDNIKIPEWIHRNPIFGRMCVRGIFATDGCLFFHDRNKKAKPYARLKITSKSKILMYQIKVILNQAGIRNSISCDKRITKRHPNKIWEICIYGQKKLDKFVREIGFSNPKHFKAYKEWNSAGGGI